MCRNTETHKEIKIAQKNNEDTKKKHEKKKIGARQRHLALDQASPGLRPGQARLGLGQTWYQLFDWY